MVENVDMSDQLGSELARDLSLAKRIIFRIFGRVYLEHRQHEDWSGPNPFYLVKCPEHGPFEDYPHGYKEELRCPICSACARNSD